MMTIILYKYIYTEVDTYFKLNIYTATNNDEEEEREKKEFRISRVVAFLAPAADILIET
jgi:hypothetical protein